MSSLGPSPSFAYRVMPFTAIAIAVANPWAGGEARVRIRVQSGRIRHSWCTSPAWRPAHAAFTSSPSNSTLFRRVSPSSFSPATVSVGSIITLWSWMGCFWKGFIDLEAIETTRALVLSLKLSS